MHLASLIDLVVIFVNSYEACLTAQFQILGREKTNRRDSMSIVGTAASEAA